MSQQQTWSFQNTSPARSFLWSLAITVLPVASGFIVSWVIARWAGPSVVGTVSWVMSFATAVLIVGKFGLDLATSRLATEYGVQNPGYLRRLFRTGFGLRLLFTGVVALLSFVFAAHIAAFFNDPNLLWPIRVGALVVVCASLYEFKENFLIGLNRLGTVYKIRSLNLVSRVLLTIILVSLGFSASTILGGYCAAWLLAIGAYAILLHRYLPSDPVTETPEAGSFRRLFLLSATLAVSSASVTIFTHMDRLMLGYFWGVEEVGQFAVARNIAEVSLFPVFAMIMMLRPALASRYSEGEMSQCSLIIRRSMRFSLVSGVLFASILAVLGIPLITTVFSDSFRYAGELMILFIWIIAFRSIGSVILPALVAADRTRVYAYLTTGCAVINFVLNLVLIPKYQARGAIMATIVSYGVLLLAGLKEVFDTYELRIGIRSISLGFRTILAGVLASTLIWWLFHQNPAASHAFLWAALLAVLYVLLIFMFRVGTFSDVRSLLINLRNTKG